MRHAITATPHQHHTSEPHQMDTTRHTTDTETTGQEPGRRVLLTVEAAARQLSIGRTTMYALIKSGEIFSVRVGQLRRVPADALNAYVQQLAHQHQTAA
jgi:excisionase family DNA binding protein